MKPSAAHRIGNCFDTLMIAMQVATRRPIKLDNSQRDSVIQKESTSCGNKPKKKSHDMLRTTLCEATIEAATHQGKSPVRDNREGKEDERCCTKETQVILRLAR